MKGLQQAVHDYLAMRRALGYQLLSAGPALADFVAFLNARRTSHITIKMALEWAQKAGAQPTTWANRLALVRGFARYRSATDARTEVPPTRLVSWPKKRATPYLYKDDEVRSLLNVCLSLSPNDVLRKWTYHGLLGLLAITGMRLSEALSLRVSDVDLANALLTVRGTKFGKSRLVPIHNSTRRVLMRYKLRRDQYLKGHSASEFFFVTTRGTRLDKNNFRGTFHKLSRQIGLRDKFNSHGPRLHDFRHRFAIWTLVRWYRSGKNVEQRLPALSTYLGHVHPDDTYWYLTACPELMGEAVKQLDKHWRTVDEK